MKKPRKFNISVTYFNQNFTKITGAECLFAKFAIVFFKIK